MHVCLSVVPVTHPQIKLLVEVMLSAISGNPPGGGLLQPSLLTVRNMTQLHMWIDQ